MATTGMIAKYGSRTRKRGGKYAYHEPVGDPCTSCGIARRYHRVRHAPGCQCGASHKGGRSPSDKARTRASRQYIIGLDGEGWGAKPHRYTMLCWSNEGGNRARWASDSSGLSTHDCLSLLADLPKDALAFGYFLGYDWTKILTDLPNNLIYRLFRPETRAIPKDEGGGFSPIEWDGYCLDYLAGCMRIKRKGASWRTIWDAGKFYQTSFVKALEGNSTSQDVVDYIAAMKARRNAFSADSELETHAYCMRECALLAGLIRELISGFEAVNLKLTSYYGPGSAASALLKRESVKSYIADPPPQLADKVSRAFFGGRFENRAIGEFAGPIYTADIVSAYPAACVELPSLIGRWTHTRSERDILSCEYALVHWIGDGQPTKRAWGALPFRLPNGSIVFPSHGGEGYTWLQEWLIARQWGSARFAEAWIYEPASPIKPLASIADLFAERIRVGKNTSAGKALKLAINSCYGKIAQSVGNPPYRSQVWAGMITSHCRAKLLSALYEHDSDILSVATDGLMSTKPLRGLDVGASLGQWELESRQSLTLIRPGIYWTDKEAKTRGAPKTVVEAQRQAIMSAYDRGLDSATLPAIRQFGGAKGTITTSSDGEYNRSELYGEWYERDQTLSFSPAPKRRIDWGLWTLPQGVVSAPYDAAKASIVGEHAISAREQSDFER